MIDIDDKVKEMFYLCKLAFTAVDTGGVQFQFSFHLKDFTKIQHLQFCSPLMKSSSISRGWKTLNK